MNPEYAGQRESLLPLAWPFALPGKRQVWGEMKQNTNTVLMLAGANQKLMLHSLANKHYWGSVGKMGSTWQFTLQLLPYLLETLSHAN